MKRPADSVREACRQAEEVIRAANNPPTEHAAIATFLAYWSSLHPSDRPLRLVGAVEALGEAFNAASLARAKSSAARTNPGRKRTVDRKKIEKAHKKGLSVSEIVKATGYSAATIRTVIRGLEG